MKIKDQEYYENLLAEVVRERENYNGMHQAAVMEIDRLRAVLKQIDNMDPDGIRADDLGRAARIARDGGIPRAQPMPPYNFQEPDNGTNSTK